MATRAAKRLSPPAMAGLAILAFGLALAVTAAILPYYGGAATQERLAERAAELRFLEKKIGDAPNSRQAIGETDDYAPMFVAGTTPGLGLAELQRRVSELAAQSGMTLERAQPLPADRQDSAAMLQMDVEMTGGIQSLRDFLLALETGLPVIFVRQARIASAPGDTLVIALRIESHGLWEVAAK